MTLEDPPPNVRHRDHFVDERGPVRVAAHGRAAFPLSFAGGEVQLPKPTRAELVLSARQWVAAIRDHSIDWNCHNDRMAGYLERLEGVLTELETL